MGYVLIQCGCMDTECIYNGIYMVVAFIFKTCYLYFKFKEALGGAKAMGTHASRHGPGRMDAGGRAPGARAGELVLWRGMNEAVCLQVSADSDARRLYR